jgi:hypothetical protein
VDLTHATLQKAKNRTDPQYSDLDRLSILLGTVLISIVFDVYMRASMENAIHRGPSTVTHLHFSWHRSNPLKRSDELEAKSFFLNKQLYLADLLDSELLSARVRVRNVQARLENASILTPITFSIRLPWAFRPNSTLQYGIAL